MKTWLLLITAVLTGLAVTAQAADDITVKDAWVREAPPGVTVLAAYLTIDNKSAKSQTLSGASSPQFDSVEIHRTEIKSGVASMVAVPRIAIDAQGTLTFAPNGYHLMLIGPRQPVHAGDHVELKLQFDDHAAQTIHATVRADDAPATDTMQHQHHH